MTYIVYVYKLVIIVSIVVLVVDIVFIIFNILIWFTLNVHQLCYLCHRYALTYH